MGWAWRNGTEVYVTFFGNRTADIFFYSAFAAGIAAVNLLLIILILRSKPIRTKSKYVIILTISVIDLLTGVCITSAEAHVIVVENFLPCTVQKLEGALGVLTPPIGVLAVLCLNTNALVQHTLTRFQESTRRLLCCGLIGIFIFVPIIILGPVLKYGQINSKEDECFVILGSWYSWAADISLYWIPTFMVILTSILIVCRRKTHVVQLEDPNVDTVTTSWVDLVAAAIVSVVLFMPSYVLDHIQFNISDWFSFDLAAIVLGSLALCKRLFLPFVWFSNASFRKSVWKRSASVPYQLQTSYMQDVADF